MNYEFSLSSLIIGLAITLAGVAFVRWHRLVADNLGKGVIDYDKFKLWAFLTCLLGLLVALNLHFFLLSALFNLLFGRN